MHSKRLIPTLVITACGFLLTGAGAVAAVNPPATRAGAAAPAAQGATSVQASGGGVFLTAYQNDDLPGATTVLSGAIGDFGEAVSVLPNGTVDPEHSSQLRLELTQGSFRIVIGPLHAKFINALNHAHYNLKTCSGNATATGATPVVAGSGTGAYAGISGSLTLTITGNEVDANPGCQPFSGSALLAQSIVIAGSGTVSLR